MTIPILYCLVSGSAITDILKNKIFNTWLLMGCIARFLLLLTDSGTHEMLLATIFRACITLVILLPVYLIRGIGGGDLKLFAVLSMFLKVDELIITVMAAFLIAAIFGMIKLVIIRRIPCTIHFAVPIMISVLLVSGRSLICT